MITVRQAERNIYRVAKQATPEHWNYGRTWYKSANVYCSELALAHSVTLAQVVGCLAVLSPNCKWETNKLAVVDMLTLGESRRQVYPDNVEKAKRILAGEEPLSIMSMSHKRYGSKVRAFYENILSPESSQAVTVDTHAIRAAFDLADLPRNTIRWAFESKSGNSTIQEAYRNVAKRYGIQPSELQATVWLAVKTSLERGE